MRDNVKITLTFRLHPPDLIAKYRLKLRQYVDITLYLTVMSISFLTVLYGGAKVHVCEVFSTAN